MFQFGTTLFVTNDKAVINMIRAPAQFQAVTTGFPASFESGHGGLRVCAHLESVGQPAPRPRHVGESRRVVLCD